MLSGVICSFFAEFFAALPRAGDEREPYSLYQSIKRATPVQSERPS